MYRFIPPVLHLLGLTLYISGAQAAVITNLGDKPQTVEIAVANGFSPVIIPPNETWRTPGKVVVRFHDSVVHMEDSEEFAIWKNGDFGPQKHITHSIGNMQ